MLCECKLGTANEGIFSEGELPAPRAKYDKARHNKHDKATPFPLLFSSFVIWPCPLHKRKTR